MYYTTEHRLRSQSVMSGQVLVRTRQKCMEEMEEAILRTSAGKVCVKLSIQYSLPCNSLT